MDSLIKLLSIALASVVKAKGKLIETTAEMKRTQCYNRVSNIEDHIEHLEKRLEVARKQLAEAQEREAQASVSLSAAKDVRDHYNAHADEVLGFYPSTTAEK